MIMLNVNLKNGGRLSFNPQNIEAIGLDPDGYAFIRFVSGAVDVTDLSGSAEMQTDEIEVVMIAGVEVRRHKMVTVDAIARLRSGIDQAIAAQLGSLQRKQALRSPGVFQ